MVDLTNPHNNNFPPVNATQCEQFGLFTHSIDSTMHNNNKNDNNIYILIVVVGDLNTCRDRRTRNSFQYHIGIISLIVVCLYVECLCVLLYNFSIIIIVIISSSSIIAIDVVFTSTTLLSSLTLISVVLAYSHIRTHNPRIRLYTHIHIDTNIHIRTRTLPLTCRNLRRLFASIKPRSESDIRIFRMATVMVLRRLADSARIYIYLK